MPCGLKPFSQEKLWSMVWFVIFQRVLCIFYEVISEAKKQQENINIKTNNTTKTSWFVKCNEIGAIKKT